MEKLTEVKLPTNRKFGLFFCIIFLFISIYYFIGKAIIIGKIFLLVSGFFFIIAIVKPKLLLPLNKVWMRFGYLLGMIVSPIVLGIIFFGLFTPVAFGMRLFGRDELRLKPNKYQSFWKLKEINQRSSKSFKDQF
ncbi:MAG: SxtJ family membrane protein [Paracoccaceae bacterium]